jgi:hypothetical protein
MNALKDLCASERGLLAVALIIAATVLAALGHMSVEDWRSFAVWIFGIYVGGKSLTSAALALKPAALVAPVGEAVVAAVAAVAKAPAAEPQA